MGENVKAASDGTAGRFDTGSVVIRVIFKVRGGSRCFTILIVEKTGSKYIG